MTRDLVKIMTTLTIKIPDALKEFVDHEVVSGRYADSSAYVETLIIEALRAQWLKDADQKLREALAEYDRDECVPYNKGDCEKMVRDYLNQKRAI